MLPYFKFHHIGYAVKDIGKAARFYLNAGWSMSDVVLDPIQNTYISFLSKDGFPLIEFVSPVDEKSPVVKILEKSGNTTYHICYAVEDIYQTVIDLRKLHFLPLFKPAPAIALSNKLICYLYNPVVGLIEIVQEK